MPIWMTCSWARLARYSRSDWMARLRPLGEAKDCVVRRCLEASGRLLAWRRDCLAVLMAARDQAERRDSREEDGEVEGGWDWANR